MTEIQAIGLMIDHLKGQFPRSCSNCQRRFPTLRDYFENTKPAGEPISYDLELGEAKPQSPMGAVAFSNCHCGSTLGLTSKGMPLLRLWSLMHWVKHEAQRRGMTLSEFLQYLRGEVRKKVLSEPDENPRL